MFVWNSYKTAKKGFVKKSKGHFLNVYTQFIYPCTQISFVFQNTDFGLYLFLELLLLFILFNIIC